jgi:hypothetical protein
MTTADHIPARTGPALRPFAGVSIQAANITRRSRTLPGIATRERDRHPATLLPGGPALSKLDARFWCF